MLPSIGRRLVASSARVPHLGVRRFLSTSRVASAACAVPARAAAAVAASAAVAAAFATDQFGAVCMPLEEWHEQAPAAAAAEAAIAHLETDPNYVRIDKLFSAHMAGHAIFDSLGAKTNAIHTYRIYCTRDGRETVAVATLMPGSDGHPGIVHGGVTALLFDNTLGWMNAVARLAASGDLQATLDGKPVSDDTAATFGFTAFLHTNYRAPCKVGSTLVLVCSVERAEGRKLYVQGKARDSATGQLIADSNALFVRPRGPASS